MVVSWVSVLICNRVSRLNEFASVVYIQISCLLNIVKCVIDTVLLPCYMFVNCSCIFDLG